MAGIYPPILSEAFKRTSLFDLLIMRGNSETEKVDVDVYLASLTQANDRPLDSQLFCMSDFDVDLVEIMNDDNEFEYLQVKLDKPQILWNSLTMGRCFHLYTNNDVMSQGDRDQDVPTLIAKLICSFKLFLPEKIMVVGRFEGLHEDDVGQWKNSFESVHVFFLHLLLNV